MIEEDILVDTHGYEVMKDRRGHTEKITDGIEMLRKAEVVVIEDGKLSAHNMIINVELTDEVSG